MAAAATAIGAEDRPTILPAKDPAGPSFFGPKYNPTDFVPLPGDIGVRRGDSMDDVNNAIKGVAYYADTIGFGESSNSLTSGMDFQKFGVNYFMKSGAKCSNGADMWVYVETIPKGNALGTRVQKGLASAGLPAMRGLAPGMLEDVENALNPAPLVKALFNGAYPSCRLVTQPVGDEKGRISDPESGEMWVEGKVEYKNGRPYQTRWIQDTMLSREEWETAPKTHLADGSPIQTTREGFETYPTGVELATALTVAALAALFVRFR